LKKSKKEKKMSLSLFEPLENLVNKEHPYRRFMQLLDFESLTKRLKELENTEVGRHGYSMSKGISNAAIAVCRRFK
jgi:hypothetical protein